jgi:homopolymeric O-antigen transport system permease protein
VASSAVASASTPPAPTALAVVTALTRADLRSRYGRGPAQFVKWLVDPFAAAGVYLLLITFVLNRAGYAPGLSIACAVVPFQLLISSIVTALFAVQRRKAIVINMPFRRGLIPVAVVATESVAFVSSLVLLVMMMAVYGVTPGPSVLWILPAIALTVVLSLACAVPACLLGLWFPDLRNFVVSFVRTIFFLAPSLVALNAVPSRARGLLELNPLSGVFELYRDALLYGHGPELWQFAVPLGFSAIVLVVFGPIYRREQRHFAKAIVE